MLIVKHEKLVQETFGLIELELVYKGYRCMLKVPSTTLESRVEYIKSQANKAIVRALPDVFGETK